MDIVDSATRSRMMSGIRGKNTWPEKLVRSLLHRHGFRFRLHVKDLPGKPDIVLPRFRAVVLVHGCFWHGHTCRLFRLPTTRADFWESKISRNRTNDRANFQMLQELGWRIATVWECALKGKDRMDQQAVTDALSTWLRGCEGAVVLSSLDKGSQP